MAVLNFADRVVEAVRAKKSCVIVGLDPRPESLPAEFGLCDRPQADDETIAAAFLEFNKRIIRAISPFAVAVKPQSAFYEQLGWRGVRAYEETVSFARQHDLLVIGDVKRADIGATAEAYASAHLDRIKADAVTVNPYFGSDGVKPFLQFCSRGKGVFVLVRTTNPSSAELQDWPGSGSALWGRVAELVAKWGEEFVGKSGYSAVGAVVGATFPEVAAELRKLLPQAIFLLPGYGAQGADAEGCRACFSEDGLGALVSSSRGVIFAHLSEPWRSRFGEKRWEEAVKAAAQDMQQKLELVRASRMRR